MWISAHETWKAFLMRHVAEWAGSTQKSKFTVVDDIAVTHKAIGGQHHSRVFFDPNSSDEYNRLKANCTAFFRYVEDQDDEKNLFDLLPSILATLPMKDRVNFASQYLRPAGLSVQPIENDTAEGFTMTSVIDAQVTISEAMKSMAVASIDPTPENLEIAEREVARATRKFERMKAFIGGARSKCKNIFNKVAHRKPKVTA